jgi:uncharacterized protein YcaQ
VRADREELGDHPDLPLEVGELHFLPCLIGGFQVLGNREPALFRLLSFSDRDRKLRLRHALPNEKSGADHHRRDDDDTEADDFLALKSVAAAGLTRLNGVKVAYAYGHKATAAEEAAWRDRWVADGSLVEVKVEGWKQVQVAPGTDASLIEDLGAGRVPGSWKPLETTTEEEATFLSPLDPVSARGRAKPLFGFDYVWEVYKPVSQRSFGYYTMPILWGDRLVGRFDPKLDRATGTLMILGLWLEDPASAKDPAFVEALAAGTRRFMAFLDVRRIDVAAVTQPSLRRPLARLGTRGRPRSRVS